LKVHCCVAAVLLALAAQFAYGDQSSRWRVAQQPAKLVNGAPVLFRVGPPERLAALRGAWLGHQISFRRSAKCMCWYALAGVPLDTRPAEYVLELEGATVGGRKLRFSQTERVVEANYPSTTITVAPKYVQPPKELLARVEEEQSLKKKIFSETSAESLWSGRFEPPAAAAVTAVFGSARVYNGIKRSQHEGLDFRVHTGTPVRAANAGRVILARNLYFEGNCLMVDHGQGLITVYMHLSKFRVKEGEQVREGQVLGLSGGTGRVTGPHLHFAVRWQGEYLNPATLLKLTPP
jgi:murein DD-endopeptidase MepM/ murein hydrolase activator NlpD